MLTIYRRHRKACQHRDKRGTPSLSLSDLTWSNLPSIRAWPKSVAVLQSLVGVGGFVVRSNLHTVMLGK
jgi:hypothetical protein